VKRVLRRWSLWLLLAAMLGAVGAMLVLDLLRERERAELQELESLSAQAKVIQDKLISQLNTINRSLLFVQQAVPHWRTSPAGQLEGLRTLKNMETAIPSVRTFLVLDAQGVVTFSNREELLARNFYPPDYVPEPLTTLDAGRLYVSAPQRSVLNTELVNLTRALLDPQGRFVGLVAVGIDRQDLDTLLNSVRDGNDLQVALVQGDGKLLSSQPQAAVPDTAALEPFFSEHLRSRRDNSDFMDAVSANGALNLIAMRTISPVGLALEKPLVLVLSRPEDALLAVWKSDVLNLTAAYVLLVVIGVLGVLLFQRQRTQNVVVGKRLQLATEASGVGIWEFDLVTKKYQWDNTMFTLFGLDPTAASPRNDDWIKLLTPQDLQRMRDATRATIKHDQPFSITFQIRRPDGQVRFMRNRAALYSDGDGAPLRLIGVAEDVTQRKQQEAELSIAATAFESHESMIVTNAQVEILRVNLAFTSLFGYTSDEVVGRHPRLLKSGRHEREFYAAMWAELTQHHSWQGEVWNKRKSGEEFPCRLCITAVRDEGGVVTHYVANQTDITLRKAAEDEVKRLAFFDPLTQLPNRRLLTDRIHQALSKAKRDGGQLALIFVDLDKFKPINDRYGHAAGDQLLQAVAHRLRVCVRESDTVARVGGDEFVVLLTVVHQTSDATCVAEKIHASLRLPFDLPLGQSVQISSSIGVALYPEHGLDEATLSHHADVAMYTAKTGGRDQYVVYAPTLDAQEHG
jgi:diguanylate cyclase (GGDEF)-like protein/PAS domain S-box-containing protein